MLPIFSILSCNDLQEISSELKRLNREIYEIWKEALKAAAAFSVSSFEFRGLKSLVNADAVQPLSVLQPQP